MPTGKMAEVKLSEVSITHPVAEGLIAAVDVLVSGDTPPVTVPARLAVGRRTLVGVAVASTMYWIYHLPLVVSSVS